MPMRLGSPMPSLEGATEWFNATTIPEVQPGQTALVHFFAVSCHICHETMHDVIRIKDEYAGQGLVTFAIHMPRYEADTDVSLVRKDIEEYGIAQPLAVDNQHAITNRFENEYVPAFFVFGSDGLLKFRTAGDKGFQKLEPKIREALGLQGVAQA
jgi:thiol-disulfide isomerase/thioredoxin